MIADDDDNLTLEQAAKKAHCSTGHLRKLAAAGLCPATKIGRPWVFPRHKFQQWIDRRAIDRCSNIPPMLETRAARPAPPLALARAPVALLCKAKGR